METKQVIVMRKDLNMRKGKIAAQAAHASMGALLKCFRKYTTSDNTTVYETEFGQNCVLDSWLNGKFTKICVSVDSEKELLDIYESIPDDMPKTLITDVGLTEFNGIPTITCFCVGPFTSEDIDLYTGHLKLL